MASFWQILSQGQRILESPKGSKSKNFQPYVAKKKDSAKLVEANVIVQKLLSPQKHRGRYASVKHRSSISSSSSPPKSKSLTAPTIHNSDVNKSNHLSSPTGDGRNRQRHSSPTPDKSSRPRKTRTTHDRADFISHRVKEDQKPQRRRRRREASPSEPTQHRRRHRHEPIFEAPLVSNSRATSTEMATKDCSVCMDSLPERDLHKLPCSHYWCRNCSIAAFRLSITDPSTMPPKCCSNNEVHIDSVRRTWHGMFDTEFKQLWARKYAEHNDLSPIYCPRKDCSTWIPKSLFRRSSGSRNPETARCPKCQEKTCKACRMRSHGERPCALDQTDQEVLEMIKNEPKSQQCPRCRNGVSKTKGCNHMSCMCGCQFCLKCGLEWTGENCANGCPYIEHIPDPEEDRAVAEGINRQMLNAAGQVPNARWGRGLQPGMPGPHWHHPHPGMPHVHGGPHPFHFIGNAPMPGPNLNLPAAPRMPRPLPMLFPQPPPHMGHMTHMQHMPPMPPIRQPLERDIIPRPTEFDMPRPGEQRQRPAALATPPPADTIMAEPHQRPPRRAIMTDGPTSGRQGGTVQEIIRQAAQRRRSAMTPPTAERDVIRQAAEARRNAALFSEVERDLVRQAAERRRNAATAAEVPRDRRYRIERRSEGDLENASLQLAQQLQAIELGMEA